MLYASFNITTKLVLSILNNIFLYFWLLIFLDEGIFKICCPNFSFLSACQDNF